VLADSADATLGVSVSLLVAGKEHRNGVDPVMGGLEFEGNARLK
jgi:hypothetical protein